MIDWNKLSEDEFRHEVRTFYKKKYPASLDGVWHHLTWDETRGWYKKLYEKGWAAPSWPVEHGGMNLDISRQLIFNEERLDVARGPDFVGISMLGPILIQYGTEDQKRAHLTKTLAGEHRWAQGYSEPGAGSDLASLKTEARLEGGEYVINGQKIWTSWALDATHIFVLVCTDKQAAKKQQGISFLLADIKSPGITIRGIRNLTGRSAFCEVFFDNVRVPKLNLVGEPNKGWTVAKSLVGMERLFIGSPKHCQFALDRLTRVVRARGLDRDAGYLDEITKLRLDVEDLATLYAYFADIVRRGEELPVEVAMLKIFATDTLQLITEKLLEVSGESGVMTGGATFGDYVIDPLNMYYMARPTTIGGGSNEVLRDVLAKQLLACAS